MKFDWKTQWSLCLSTSEGKVLETAASDEPTHSCHTVQSARLQVHQLPETWNSGAVDQFGLAHKAQEPGTRVRWPCFTMESRTSNYLVSSCLWKCLGLGVCPRFLLSSRNSSTPPLPYPHPRPPPLLISVFKVSSRPPGPLHTDDRNFHYKSHSWDLKHPLIVSCT